MAFDYTSAAFDRIGVHYRTRPNFSAFLSIIHNALGELGIEIDNWKEGTAFNTTAHLFDILFLTNRDAVTEVDTDTKLFGTYQNDPPSYIGGFGAGRFTPSYILATRLHGQAPREDRAAAVNSIIAARRRGLSIKWLKEQCESVVGVRPSYSLRTGGARVTFPAGTSATRMGLLGQVLYSPAGVKIWYKIGAQADTLLTED